MVKVCTDTEFTRPFLLPDGIKYSYSHPKARKSMGYYMDGTLKSNIDRFLIPSVKSRFDSVTLVTGLEGAGKDTLASSLARYIDPTFNNVDRECFTVDQLMEQIDTCRPESAIVFSEAVMGMLAQDASTSIQVRLIKKFVTMRSKRLCVFLCLPSIFLLRRYFAVLRTKSLIHVFSPDSVHRGYFKFYGMDSKRKLYLQGAKMMDMGCVRPDFMGRFTNTWGCFFDANEYEAKKQATVAALSHTDSSREKVSISTERMKSERNVALLAAYKFAQSWYDLEHPGIASKKPMNDSRFSKLVLERLQWKISPAKVHSAREAATGFLEEYWKHVAAGQKIDEAFGDLSSMPQSEKDRIKEEMKEETETG